ncbi:MAG: TonB-dependent receptor [Burkholderiales bacterium]|nr:TonB-dependent receptor [Burkholderiales bacterium]
MRFPAPALIAAALGFAFSSAGAAPRDDDLLEAREVVVTAPSVDGTVRTTAHGVSVITAAEIERSTATSVGELLGREANLNLQSYFGSDKRATVDIRGMGQTASSNVLVLVDGERLNENDLSGADLSVVPLSQIERIEIVRGGGAVRYGSGAVGGVINIITRRARTGPTAFGVLGRAGSYQTGEARLNAGGSMGAWAGNLTASAFDTNGYRQNSFVTAQDVAAELRWLPKRETGLVDAYLRAAYHHDQSGLPGPVSASAFAGSEAQRRASSFPNDYGSTTDQRITAGGTVDLGNAGRIIVQTTFRDRENPFTIGFNPAIPPDMQRSLIESKRVDLSARYSIGATVFGLPQTFDVGIDARRADYSRSENGENVVGSSSRRTGELRNYGLWANTTLAATSSLAVNAGLRGDWSDTSEQTQNYASGGCQNITTIVLVDVDPGPGVVLVPTPVIQQVGCTDAYRTISSRQNNARNRGAELGLTWQATQRVTAFASYTRNFRIPNVDELLLASADLRAQTGTTLEAGLRASVSESFETSVTLFEMRIADEILFGRDPVTGLAVNRNASSPTRRTGLELEARWRLHPTLTLRGSVGLVNARFDDTDATMPLVPRTTGSADLLWSPREWLRTSFSARYVGSRYDGNDPTNTLYPKLPSYVVCDLAVRVPQGRWLWSAVAANLFDEVYTTVGYSATYYPMPGRSFYLEGRYRF